MPNAEKTRCYQPSKNIKIHCGTEGSVMKKKCRKGYNEQGREEEASRKFLYDCETFAGIAKISQP